MKLEEGSTRLEMLAAAHALGTLRGGARRRFEALAREQPAVRASALAWQSRLSSMSELQRPVMPDPAVWTRIRNLIQAEREQQQMHDRAEAARKQPAPARPGGFLQSLLLWRSATAAGLLASVLAIAVGLKLEHQLRAAPVVQYVAVLSDDRSAANLLVTFDPKHGQLTLQRVGGFREGQNQSLQLWALTPGGAPRSLGVLGKEAGLHLPAREADMQAVPALAVSLEPLGGVPSDRGPTGPVLFHGPLIEKML